MFRHPNSSKRWWRRSSLAVAILLPAAAVGQFWPNRSAKTGNEVDPYNKDYIIGEKYFLELGSQQVGGVVDGRYTMAAVPGQRTVGVLRCRAGEAMVGVTIRVGGVVDHMQIHCSTVRWDARGRRYFWQGAPATASAGTPGGGQHQLTMGCPGQHMISGFRAFTSGNGLYLKDVRFECAMIRSAATLALDIDGRGPKGFMVFDRDYAARTGVNNARTTSQFGSRLQYRTWAPLTDSRARQIPFQNTGYDDLQPETFCENGGATGISYGLGRYSPVSGFGQKLPGGPIVVQAMTLLCAGDRLTEGYAPRKGFF